MTACGQSATGMDVVGSENAPLIVVFAHGSVEVHEESIGWSSHARHCERAYAAKATAEMVCCSSGGGGVMGGEGGGIASGGGGEGWDGKGGGVGEGLTRSPGGGTDGVGAGGGGDLSTRGPQSAQSVA